MTNSELSNEFDILYNNITSNQAPGLNEYEKSVFLTKAQSQLVNEYFNSKTDGVGGGFDGSQKRQYDFSSIIKAVEVAALPDAEEKLDSRSIVYIFPEDYFLAVNEIIVTETTQFSVMPIDYSEYQRLMLKPYNFPVKKGAWRIITSRTTIIETIGEGETATTISTQHPVVEIIGNFKEGDTLTYKLRYVKTLNPIILEDLEDYGTDFSIKGEKIRTECELPEEMHQEILERAVTLAKIAWQGGTVTQASQQGE